MYQKNEYGKVFSSIKTRDVFRYFNFYVIKINNAEDIIIKGLLLQTL
jgi:hypothetical protein